MEKQKTAMKMILIETNTMVWTAATESGINLANGKSINCCQ